MAWALKGSYVGTCQCRLVCACAMDGPPSGPDGICKGVAVFTISEGNLDDVDLTGIVWGLTNEWPNNPSSGSWRVGLIIDAGASDQQAAALERILSGQEGGPFAEMGQFVTEFLGVQRAKITFSDGERPSGSIEGMAEIGFEPHTGSDGNPTTVSNAVFGFAPTFKIGKGSGSSNVFGISFQSSYGEAADYVFTQESADRVRA